MATPLRIVTSFNSRLYKASGEALLRSIRQYLGDVQVLVYFESRDLVHPRPSGRARRRDYPGIRQYGTELVDLLRTESFRTVSANNRERIPMPGISYRAGSFGDPEHDYWNRRWFQWFCKIAAQFDAMSTRPMEPAGITLWLDSDARVIAPFTSNNLEKHISAPIGFMRGTRVAPETGVIVFDERRPETLRGVREIWQLFASGSFVNLPRWDDGYVYGAFSERRPELFQDFAAGLSTCTHTNTNGHTTREQILPLTPLGKWFEHDKGLHGRMGIDQPPENHSLLHRGWICIKERRLPERLRQMWRPQHSA